VTTIVIFQPLAMMSSLLGRILPEVWNCNFVVPFCKELNCRYIFINPSRCNYVCRRF